MTASGLCAEKDRAECNLLARLCAQSSVSVDELRELLEDQAKGGPCCSFERRSIRGKGGQPATPLEAVLWFCRDENAATEAVDLLLNAGAKPTDDARSIAQDRGFQRAFALLESADIGGQIGSRGTARCRRPGL